jgi:hypothetical protein
MSEPVVFRFGRYNGQPLSVPPVAYLEWLAGDNDDGSPRCQSKWFYGRLTAEIARRTGGDHEPPPEHREPVRTHPNAPAGSDRWMNTPKPGIDPQRLFTALATINSKLDDILARLGEPVAAGTDPDDIAF